MRGESDANMLNGFYRRIVDRGPVLKTNGIKCERRKLKNLKCDTAEVYEPLRLRINGDELDKIRDFKYL